MKAKDVTKDVTKKKKSMGTIIWIGVILLLPILVFILQYPVTKDFGTSGVFQQEEVETMATEIITLFGNQEYEKILENYAGEQLKKSAGAEDFAQAYISVSEDWGEVKEIGAISLSEMKRSGILYALAKAQVTYENVTVNYTLTFGENMKFEGIYMEDALQK